MLCSSGFELYSRWVPLFFAKLLHASGKAASRAARNKGVNLRIPYCNNKLRRGLQSRWMR